MIDEDRVEISINLRLNGDALAPILVDLERLDDPSEFTMNLIALLRRSLGRE